MSTTLVVFTPIFQLVYLAGALLLFAFVALLTRPDLRKMAGALLAVAVFTALSAPIDTFGLWAGLWSYPSCPNPPHPPLAVYIGQAFEFVGTLALIGWRVRRRFGRRGTVALFSVVCGFGPVRDFSVAALFPAVLRFDAGPAASLLADVGAWAIVVIVALAVPQIIPGPESANGSPSR